MLCWIGATDLRASQGDDVGEGPIAKAVEKLGFDEVFLISNYLSDDRVAAYVEWAKKRSSTPYQLYEEKLSSPTHFGEIYEAAVRVCTAALGEQRNQVGLTFHLSAGTPAMAAVWIILAKTRFPAELIESSIEARRSNGVCSLRYFGRIFARPSAQTRRATPLGQRRETHRIGKFCRHTLPKSDYGTSGRASAARRAAERSRFARRRIRHRERTFCPRHSSTQPEKG